MSENTIGKILKVPYGLAEAPVAWYRRLTAEMEKAGWEQIRSDPCLFVIRDRSGTCSEHDMPILAICGVHVDDLLMAGDLMHKDVVRAMKNLESALPFGSRKYADEHPIMYTGLEIKQLKDRTIYLTQWQYIQNIKPACLKAYKGAGPLDKAGAQAFGTLLGELLWVVVNSRPDAAFDVSYYAGFAQNPEREHLAALNKVLRYLQSGDYPIKYARVSAKWSDCLLYTSPSPRDLSTSRMPSSA